MKFNSLSYIYHSLSLLLIFMKMVNVEYICEKKFFCSRFFEISNLCKCSLPAEVLLMILMVNSSTISRANGSQLLSFISYSFLETPKWYNFSYLSLLFYLNFFCLQVLPIFFFSMCSILSSQVFRINGYLILAKFLTLQCC